ncbi:phenylalanine 4-monooxygenase [Vibrio tubiashii]|uniref:Phenylalanine-4-hydroxylase n=1 Tax=Vibrio tubiashii ATCC 19109 TaxID=1051646 RepID=F9T8G9_9VIBR|nr:phenylalanine 4-monooxygenase [Vibrio tubiashii]AIW16013.1 phenylalanine 4-monooxygenase [Vibrio tubiashii ATCC 19109]EGU52749.1 phenylalanine 4-monooxygenase [Vibrio tubiashii ATCC 19109]EIF06102.1 phenylalanine 4-monooxygenase [Vibrio tubiashii NCIMB 1337 = ATCC 19106]
MAQYHSKPVNEHGIVEWSSEENEVWRDLVERQLHLVKQRACKEYLAGLELLDLPIDRAPQIVDINRVLKESTGWQVEPVPALINFDRFFALLADKKFPVATFLRTREEFDYLQEPDFFHEIFGHCAMLTNPEFAQFTQTYGVLGRNASNKERVYLARLYWFTVEFGLVKEGDKTKIYGGGILSSPGETLYALGDPKVQRVEFDIHTVFRTPYRIDIMQPEYFVLDDIQQLYKLSQLDLMFHVKQAMQAGLLPPLFEPKEVTHA